MSFRDLLTDYYQVHPEEKMVIDGRTGFLADGFVYFNMESRNLEMIQMEQAVLAYYLMENGYRHIALPVKNMKDEWFTEYQTNSYLIYQVADRNMEKASLGRSLALFHEVGSDYYYEPQTISSYGEWKTLWIDKLNLFEERTFQLMEEETAQPRIFDCLPYIIGMSENAIQYLRETEENETRYTEVDQGTIAFLRFNNQVEREVIWPDELGFDHPARDIAEFIRNCFLSGQSDSFIHAFIRDYQTIRPLSVFSWRLIYARLLFPIHFFDTVEQLMSGGDIQRGEAALHQMIRLQERYEKRLNNFYKKMEIDKGAFELVEVDWLS
ncbi:hypothetical protein [Oceanobacillus alkalisoli]|uniref:hypothetical protein n=1 Tax=Oceanobacillus alkalisoli TaxID=2925113 RepID=UPI001EF0E8BA|nr:hypothetical protein [Oceanobacillus alkalisoli]MCF3943262.1 hypothetical protein [Oceanobacillus alkalisoli]MCG5103861.1 hypothetical protein [Oceanobacillus alkalisoli]